MRKTAIAAFTLIAAASLLASAATHAATQQFEFDKSHADITFTVSHLGFSKTHGRFNEFEGTLSFDPEDIAAGAVSVSIKTDSVETSFAKRNAHLKSADFFDTEQYPEMVFTSTSLTMSSENEGQLVGDLTLLDQTHPVTLNLVVNRIAPHPRTKNLTAGFTASGVILRSVWGMTKAIPGIADEIHLVLDVEAGAVE